MGLMRNEPTRVVVPLWRYRALTGLAVQIDRENMFASLSLTAGGMGSKWSFEWPCILRSFSDLRGNRRRRQTRAEQGSDRGEIAISLIMTESSLMARSNSLLSLKKFPVPAHGEFPSTALKLLPYLAANG